MTYEEAKASKHENADLKIYVALYCGTTWRAGCTLDVSEPIGFYTTKKDARKACDDYVRIWDDGSIKQLITAVEECTNDYFED